MFVLQEQRDWFSVVVQVDVSIIMKHAREVEVRDAWKRGASRAAVGRDVGREEPGLDQVSKFSRLPHS